MFRKIVQILKNIWQQLFNSRPPESSSTQREAPKPYKPLSDADYEYLFGQLLEGIAYGWQPGRIQRFFDTLGDRAQKDRWLAWLERHGSKVLASPAPNEELGRRMVKLGEQTQALPATSAARSLGDRAQQIGSLLLSRRTLNEIWDYEGPDESLPIPQPPIDENTLPQPTTEVLIDSLVPEPPPESPPDEPSPQLPPPPEHLVPTDLSWEEILTSLQQNPELVQQVGRELGLETTNLQSVLAAITAQIEQHQDSPSSTEDAQTWFNRGVQHYECEDFSAALDCWDRAIEQQPDYYQAWNNRGLALKHLGRAPESLPCYQKALEIEPTYYKAWYNQGIVLEELERFEDAIASYDKAIELKPDYYKAWSSRGDALQHGEQYHEAVASYDRAIELQPDLADVWYSRGNALKQSADEAEAIASYDKAIELKFDTPQVWYARGEALVASGSLEEAIASFDRALQLKPDAWEIWLGRSRAAKLSSQPDLLLTSLSPIAQNNSNLNQRGENGELASLEAGLNHLYPNTHPEGWGQLHAAIGRIYARQAGEADQPEDPWHNAVSRYHEALTTLTEDAFPELHLEVLQDLIQAQWALQGTNQAQKLQQRGANLLQRLLGDSRRSESQKQHLALKFASFDRLQVDLAVQAGEFIQAWELAEQHKEIALAFPESLPSVEPLRWPNLQSLLDPATAIVSWYLSPVALTTFILRSDRPEPIVLGQPGNTVKTIVLTPALRSQLQSAKDNPAQLGQVLVELLGLDSEETPETAGDSSGDRPRETPQHLKQLGEWTNRWQDYRLQPQAEQDNLSALLAQLQDILEIPHILRTLGQGEMTQAQSAIQRLILIPHQSLQALPLPALFSLASESPDLTLSCLPSLRPEFLTQERTTPQSPSLLWVDPPASPGLEAALIGQFFPSVQPLACDRLSKTEGMAALSGGHQILHFDLKEDLTKKEEHVLSFNNGEELTREDLSALPLSSYHLVVLDPQLSQSEGLTQILLHQGIPFVLRCLWPGDATAHSLLTLEFYRHYTNGVTPPQALHQAQTWLRNATSSDLDQWYRDRAEGITDGEILRLLENKAATLQENAAKMESDRPPYAHPYYWAGFVIHGR